MFNSLLKAIRFYFEHNPSHKFDLDDLPDEVFYLLFSYMNSEELANISLVSKNWHRKVENYYQALCLQKKNDSSWKVFFNKKNHLSRFPLDEGKTILTSKKSDSVILSNRLQGDYCGARIIHNPKYLGPSFIIDSAHGMGCLSYCYEGLPYSTKFEIWDLNTDRCVSSFPCIDSEQTHQINFSYPYLLTKSESLLVIRDVSTMSNKEKVIFQTSMGNMVGVSTCMSVEKEESGFRFGYMWYQIGNASPRISHYNFKDKNQYETIAYGDEEWRVAPDSIALMHNDYFVYANYPGRFTVVNMAKLEVNLAFTPDFMKFFQVHGESCESFTEDEKNQLRKLATKNHFIAFHIDGDLLLVHTTQDILIYNIATLESIELVRHYSIKKFFPSLDRSFTLFDRLDGVYSFSDDIMLTHNMHTQKVQAYDLGNRGKLLFEVENVPKYSRYPISLYKGKLYEVSQPSKTQIKLSSYSLFSHRDSDITTNEEGPCPDLAMLGLTT